MNQTSQSIDVNNPADQSQAIVSTPSDLFRRLEQWRRKNGRNPKTGRPEKPTTRQPYVLCKNYDAKHLLVMALRMAEHNTTRDDLRQQYCELASFFESMQ